MPATILLVEDEPAVREITREALELGGYRVLTASGPAAAGRIASDLSTAIDLLLTDVIMPGMNGPELARRVHETRPELVTLFMTGYAESEALRLALVGRSQKHIQKPFTVSGLLARVADALAARWNGGEKAQAPQYSSP
jgi:CheY-like chemotaxis protein